MKSGLAIMIGLLLVFAGCERGTDRTSAAPEDVQESQREAQEDQRDQYVSTVRAKLDEMDSKLDGLEQRAAAMRGMEKTNFERTIVQLRDQRNMVEQKLDHLEDMTAESWMSMKSDVDMSLNQLENTYQQISASHEVTK